MIPVIMMVALLPIAIDRAWIRGNYPAVADEKRNEFFPAFEEYTKSEEELSTSRDTSYILYGYGNATQQTTRQLTHYIRALTSRQAPGGRHLQDQSGRQHFSQLGQSQLIDKLLKGRRGGVFLECGAYDGERMSNSLFFELHRNWTGVLIEGNPKHYPNLLSKNRNAFVVRACLSPSTVPQALKYSVQDARSGIALGMITQTVEIPCFPLNSIMEALGIRHIDYMSLDVEGPELKILKTLNWSQLSIDIMSIEYNYRPKKLNDLRSFFKDTGKYKEVALLPRGRKEKKAVDVVFMRDTY